MTRDQALAALEVFIDESIRKSAEMDHHPTRFVGMRHRRGTVAAISQLVKTTDEQSGFRKAKELGLLAWSLEQAALNFPQLFSKETRDYAEFRLKLIQA